MTNTASLYRLTSPSGRQYIGVTTKPLSYRMKEHYHFNTAVGRALRKYGESIRGEVLAIGPEEYIYDLENKAISAFGTMAPAGYNLREGGLGGRHTEDSKQKISKANKGRIFSEEHRRKIGLTSKGRVFSKESRRKMSEAQKRRYAEGRGSYCHTAGKPLSEEHKRKISDGQKRRWAARRQG